MTPVMTTGRAGFPTVRRMKRPERATGAALAGARDPETARGAGPPPRGYAHRDGEPGVHGPALRTETDKYPAVEKEAWAR